jgi:hypothetical protein
MKGPFLVIALAAAPLGGACSHPVSSVGPSAGPSSTLSPGPVAPVEGLKPAIASPAAVPFKGSFAGTQAVTPLEPPFGAVSGSGTGAATHLGQFTVAFPHTVNFATRTGVGTYTFTAANGDSVTAAFTGQATPAGSLVNLLENATITGGTGRFAGATGAFTVQRTFNSATGTTDGSFDGAISW